MSNRLEITVDGKDVEADKMLKAATTTLKLLKAIEKEARKQHPEVPPVKWRVDMMSGGAYGLIAIWANAPETTWIDTELTRLIGSHKQAQP